MKIIYVKHLLIGKRFYAINLFGVVFSRGRLDAVSINHEYIHTLQQREMLYVFFYLWYVIEWLVKLVYYRDYYLSYSNLSFEREAYRHQHNLRYHEQRPLFASLRYLRTPRQPRDGRPSPFK